VAPAAEAGREIGWDGPNIAERLDRRVDDIRRAVVSAAMAVAQSLPGMPEATDWVLEELSACPAGEMTLPESPSPREGTGPGAAPHDPATGWHRCYLVAVIGW
jgi:hypothetical protein